MAPEVCVHCTNALLNFDSFWPHLRGHPLPASLQQLYHLELNAPGTSPLGCFPPGPC